MCGRYAFFSIEELKKRFGISDEVTDAEIAASYNLSPHGCIPAVVNNSRNNHAFKSMHWQLIPSFSKKFESRYSMFNIRIESIGDVPWKAALLMTGRCIIPADNYYEWEACGKGKIPWLFKLKNNKIMLLAALYSVWRGDAGSYRLSCGIITKDADPALKSIHSRMPAIIQDGSAERWLDRDARSGKEMLEILAGHADDQIEFYRISDEVNKTENNHAGLLNRLPAANITPSAP